ncbi:MAG: valine--pyruvate transaminase [Planctomycetota bacterium]
MRLSGFGEKFARESGIRRLMDDLGQALAGGKPMLMLGGGNPSHIPAVEALFRKRWRKILADPREFGHVVGDYDPPHGEIRFIEALARLLRRECGWNITAGNIAITLGSQSSFFVLFNILAGKFRDGSRRKVLLPLAPEYIGYADAGLEEDFFVSRRPKIEFLEERIFKYHPDLAALDVPDRIGAVCVSRPTNPTGNVITDAEVAALDKFARARRVPLILDNAYGTPFPNIIFTDVRPFWNENTILCMSLSKLGLPGARAGIVIAAEPVIRAVAAANAILSLAPSGIGPALAMDLVRTGEILRVSRDVIRPYYRKRAEEAVGELDAGLKGLPCFIHKPEGALFLWLWCRDLPITSAELYERLKRRGVLVVSGHYFFPGLAGAWRHKQECIRITYSQSPRTVARGIAIIGEEVRKAYRMK